MNLELSEILVITIMGKETVLGKEAITCKGIYSFCVKNFLGDNARVIKCHTCFEFCKSQDK